MMVFVEVMKRLSDAGYSSYRLQKENLIPGSTLDRLRRGESVSTNTIETICKLCNCQPADFMVYVPDKKGEE